MLGKVQMSADLVNFRANEESRINKKFDLGKIPTPKGTPKAEAEERRLLMSDISVRNIHSMTKTLPEGVESKLKPRTGVEILEGAKRNFDDAIKQLGGTKIKPEIIDALRKYPELLMTLLLGKK